MKKLLLLCIILTLSACSIFKVDEEAQSIADSYFKERIEKGTFPYDLLSEHTFKTASDSSEWKQLVQLIDKANGKTLSYKLTSWQTSTKAMASTSDQQVPNGKSVKMVFKVTYENGVGVERITVHKPLKGGNYKIIALYCNSDMIQDFTNKSIQESLESDSL